MALYRDMQHACFSLVKILQWKSASVWICKYKKPMQSHSPHTNNETLSMFYLIHSECSLLYFLVSLFPHNKLLLQQQKKKCEPYIFVQKTTNWSRYIWCVVLQRLSNVGLASSGVPAADFLLCFGLIFSASDRFFFFFPSFWLKSNY